MPNWLRQKERQAKRQERKSAPAPAPKQPGLAKQGRSTLRDLRQAKRTARQGVRDARQNSGYGKNNVATLNAVGPAKAALQTARQNYRMAAGRTGLRMGLRPAQRAGLRNAIAEGNYDALGPRIRQQLGNRAATGFFNEQLSGMGADPAQLQQFAGREFLHRNPQYVPGLNRGVSMQIPPVVDMYTPTQGVYPDESQYLPMQGYNPPFRGVY